MEGMKTMLKHSLAGLLATTMLVTSAAYAQDGTPTPSSTLDRAIGEFSCARGETKTVVVRGAPDGFEAAGDEPNALSEGALRIPHLASSVQRMGYDSGSNNRHFLDFIEAPSNISSGRVFVGLRSLAGNFGNDNLVIGDIYSNYHYGPASQYYPNGQNDLVQRMVSSSRINQLTGIGWTQSGDMFSADFADLALRSPGLSLLDYVQSGTDITVIDLHVQDDTAVDFFAVAVCERPVRNGLTWNVRTTQAAPSTMGVISVGSGSHADGRSSDPVNGDTPCQTALPLMCFRDLEVPAPASFDDSNQNNRWSGGVIGTTVAMSTPGTLAEADTACSDEFGDGWRVAEFHDGWGWNFTAYGGVGENVDRMWVDINDQPNGVCWTR